LSRQKVFNINDKRSDKGIKNERKGAAGTVKSIADFGKSLVDLIKNEGNIQKDQFNASMKIAKDEIEKKSILKHDFKKAVLRNGTLIGCAGMACITVVYIHKNS
jgi:hypothetical protein